MGTYKGVRLFLVLCLALALWSNQAGARIINGELNKPIPANLSMRVSTSGEFKGRYLAVLRFPVAPGQTYTLDINYPVDNAPRSIAIRGYNPLVEKDLPFDKRGGYYSNFTAGFGWPCPPPPNCWKTEEFNIKVSPGGSGRFLYVIIASKMPGLQNTVVLKYPPLPDSVVKSKRIPPLCPPLDGRYYCGRYNPKSLRGTIVKVSLYELEPSSEPSYHVSQPRRGLNIDGSWQFTGDAGDRRLLELKQSGRTLTGLMHYPEGVAPVSGVVEGQEAVLRITYNDPKLISRWIPPKTAQQAVGIQAVFKLRPTDTPDKLRGLFYPWQVYWDSNQNLTRRYDGLQPGNPLNNRPYHYVLTRTESTGAVSSYSAGSGLLIEAEDEKDSGLYTPGPSEPSYQWSSRELANLPHSGRGYWYLSRKGDWLLYVFDIPVDGNYSLWIKDLNDQRHPAGARTVLINIDCENQYRVPENTRPDNSGWGWHQFGKLYLKKGRHIMKVQKEATTSGAAVIDAFYFTTGGGPQGI